MRKGFWKQPPLIWDVNPKQIRILNPFFMEIAADKLLSLPMPQPRKVKQVLMCRAARGAGRGWGVGGGPEGVRKPRGPREGREPSPPPVGAAPEKAGDLRAHTPGD